MLQKHVARLPGRYHLGMQLRSQDMFASTRTRGPLEYGSRCTLRARQFHARTHGRHAERLGAELQALACTISTVNARARLGTHAQ